MIPSSRSKSTLLSSSLLSSLSPPFRELFGCLAGGFPLVDDFGMVEAIMTGRPCCGLEMNTTCSPFLLCRSLFYSAR